ncbi:hypothetical protein VspSw1_76 [Vibrio phage VspSw_1]|uniref:Uncharacterized protein n=1 Tax=Vibrio phage VspSw_1 TaxID=2484249 RepID=A0A411BKN9_9CAUD|nr:hypothetical protein HOV08_gp076 [Vibrio phage VspSw_1]QAY02148.1 hypothetical protein VspSw1_76 [Vibrio phage VspSw_1]
MNPLELTQAQQKLHAVDSWADWMDNWITIQLDPISNKPLHYCFHPDNYCFLVTSDPEEACNGFSKYPYDG